MKRSTQLSDLRGISRYRAFLIAAAVAGLALTSASVPVTASSAPTGSVRTLNTPPDATGNALRNAVVAWNANAGRASVAACFIGGYGPQESRMYAMMHVAIHDALNGIDRRWRPYAAKLHAPHRTSRRAAVASAAHDVLVPVLDSFSFFLPADCISAGIASVEADYTTALDSIRDGIAKNRGIALGRRAAAAVLALRGDDGL